MMHYRFWFEPIALYPLPLTFRPPDAAFITLLEAAQTVAAPGIYKGDEHLKVLQAIGYVSPHQGCALDHHYEITEAGYRLCERLGFKVHRPIESFKQQTRKAA